MAKTAGKFKSYGKIIVDVQVPEEWDDDRLGDFNAAYEMLASTLNGVVRGFCGDHRLQGAQALMDW